MQAEQQSERERFEAAMVEHAKSEGYERPEYVLEKNLNGRYSTTWVHGAWIGWQARAALSHPSTPQGCDAKDAERYRHMRSSAVFQDRNGPGLYWYLPRWDRNLPDGERLDKAIDAAIGAAIKGQQASAPNDDFIGKTNREYAEWCKTHYNPDALDERGMVSLHGLWAWQEQERRKVASEEGERLTDPLHGFDRYELQDAVNELSIFGHGWAMGKAHEFISTALRAAPPPPEQGGRNA